MEGVAVKVQVNADRTVNVNLPDDVPIGEYEAVLVPVKKLAVESAQSSEAVESEQWGEAMDAFWNQWVEEVEQMPLSPQPAKSEYHKSLIEKYRKQGLDL